MVSIMSATRRLISGAVGSLTGAAHARRGPGGPCGRFSGWPWRANMASEAQSGNAGERDLFVLVALHARDAYRPDHFALVNDRKPALMGKASGKFTTPGRFFTASSQTLPGRWVTAAERAFRVRHFGGLRPRPIQRAPAAADAPHRPRRRSLHSISGLSASSRAAATIFCASASVRAVLVRMSSSPFP